MESEWNASQHTTYRISDFGEARTVESMEANMTMTSGVRTGHFMAPEVIRGDKNITEKVDVYSFAVMAAQVMACDHPPDDSSDPFDTSLGLCTHWSFTYSHKPKSTVCDWFVFSLGSCSLSHSVCGCSVPSSSTSFE